MTEEDTNNQIIVPGLQAPVSAGTGAPSPSLEFHRAATGLEGTRGGRILNTGASWLERLCIFFNMEMTQFANLPGLHKIFQDLGKSWHIDLDGLLSSFAVTNSATGQPYSYEDYEIACLANGYTPEGKVLGADTRGAPGAATKLDIAEAGVVAATNSIIYTGTADNGETFSYTKSGGSAGWRANNPGNLVYNELTISYGALGQDENGLAIFGKIHQGMMAQWSALQNGYGTSTVEQMMRTIYQADEKTLGAHLQKIAEAGIDLSTPVKNLSQEDLGMLAGEIEDIENYATGTLLIDKSVTPSVSALLKNAQDSEKIDIDLQKQFNKGGVLERPEQIPQLPQPADPMYHSIIPGA